MAIIMIQYTKQFSNADFDHKIREDRITNKYADKALKLNNKYFKKKAELESKYSGDHKLQGRLNKLETRFNKRFNKLQESTLNSIDKSNLTRLKTKVNKEGYKLTRDEKEFIKSTIPSQYRVKGKAIGTAVGVGIGTPMPMIGTSVALGIVGNKVGGKLGDKYGVYKRDRVIKKYERKGKL